SPWGKVAEVELKLLRKLMLKAWPKQTAATGTLKVGLVEVQNGFSLEPQGSPALDFDGVKACRVWGQRLGGGVAFDGFGIASQALDRGDRDNDEGLARRRDGRAPDHPGDRAMGHRRP